MAIANSDGSIIITTKLDVTPVSKALNALKSKFASLKEQRSAIQALTTAIKDQQIVIKDLEKQYAMLAAQGKGNSTNAKELKARIAELKAELQRLTGAASAMGVKTAAASTKAAQGLKKFGGRIAEMIKSALIFSVLYKVMQSVVKLFNNILMSDEEFRQDWEELKAAFYTAAYPIINLIVPAIKFIVQQVRDWAVSMGKVAAALQGMSYSELVDQAKASKEAADNYADMEKSSKKTADNVKKQLASFDDIQILSSGKEEEQGAWGAGFEGLGKYDTSGEKSMLGDLMTAIGGALIAVGLILLFHGQIAWGVGFIIAGAIAGFFGVSIATLSDESVSQKAKDELSNAMLIVGVVAIVLGILLCMAQQWAWGIGLIAVGVASIVTPIALNWDGIKEQLQGSFGGWLVLGGVIAIILGILLCFTPMLPLGIGLIVLGVGATVAPIAANWDAITERLHNFFAENAGLITGASIGLIVLGILLCFTPMIGLGIGLIVAGAAGLAGVVAVNWNAIVDWIQGAWNAVKAFWEANIAPIFTASWWLALGKNCINGLIAGFEGGINGIINAFEAMINFIVDGLNKISFDVPDWVPLIGGSKWGVNIPRADFSNIQIPRLAQGAVIPGNREFLAVLGDQPAGQTNIEAPLETIVQAFNMALNARGNETVKEEHYFLDETELMRVLYKLVKKGEQANGSDLVEGW
jgi:cell division septum initiation protein DivIVA